jgi:hypothetical protein
MKRKNMIATSLLTASWFALGAYGYANDMQTQPAPSAQRQQINPDISSPDTSYGGTQSQREKQTGVPFPEGSSYSGTTSSQSQPGKMHRDNARSAQREDNSYGGTKSERQHESGVPLPEGSAYSGTAANRPSASHARWNAMQVKEAQQALKTNGYDPGPVDGIMGPQTREAIKDFQNAKGLQATGTLDTQTAQSLGLEK